jgi:hypothetical protein
VAAALSEIVTKANTLNAQASATEPQDATRQFTKTPKAKTSDAKAPSAEPDDGHPMMSKIFVESKLIARGDFDLCWVKQDLSTPPEKIIEPFIQLLMDKGILPIEKSLKIISDRHRSGFLPLERYDVDVEFARSFPAATLKRWCVLPFDRMSKSVMVATANPFNKRAAQELEEAAKQRLIWYLAPPQDIIKALRKVIR